MTSDEPKADLQKYLQEGRDALVGKLDGVSEYDARRPLVPTGTNLLGLVNNLPEASRSGRPKGGSDLSGHIHTLRRQITV